jgi:SAM-dependent methyltransferase
MQCGVCSTVYLSPARSELGRFPPSLPSAALTRRRIRAWTAGLPSSARILVADCGAGRLLQPFARYGRGSWTVEGTEQDTQAATDAPDELSIRQGSILDIGPDAARYDLVFLPHSLEAAADPVQLLQHAGSLLAPNGRVISVTSNIASPCHRLFGGRHWSGYRYPHTRQHPDVDGLRRLSTDAGFRVIATGTVMASDTWLESLRNWLSDWDASRFVTGVLTGRWLVPNLAATCVESIAVLRNKGALLAVELEKS